MEVALCSLVATIRRGIACSLAVATFPGAAAAFGEDLTPEVTAPLLEFKERRLAIEEKAEADTKKELHTLIKKLEKLSKGTKNPKASEQAAAFLKKVKDPTFLVVGINDLINNVQGGVTGRQAEVINLAYKQRRVTAEDWAQLPGDVVQASLKAKDTGLELQPGDFVLVCPHPTQTWRENSASSWTTFDGQVPGTKNATGRQVLTARIQGNGDPQQLSLTRENGVLFQCTTKGRLTLGSVFYPQQAEGSIDCKVFKITTR
jgi:hypothetical protein